MSLSAFCCWCCHGRRTWCLFRTLMIGWCAFFAVWKSKKNQPSPPQNKKKIESWMPLRWCCRVCLQYRRTSRSTYGKHVPRSSVRARPSPVGTVCLKRKQSSVQHHFRVLPFRAAPRKERERERAIPCSRGTNSVVAPAQMSHWYVSETSSGVRRRKAVQLSVTYQRQKEKWARSSSCGESAFHHFYWRSLADGTNMWKPPHPLSHSRMWSFLKK